MWINRIDHGIYGSDRGYLEFIIYVIDMCTSSFGLREAVGLYNPNDLVVVDRELVCLDEVVLVNCIISFIEISRVSIKLSDLVKLSFPLQY